MKNIPDSAPKWECKACKHKLLTGQECLLKMCSNCGMIDTIRRIPS